jgi:hypothetical protein
MYYDGLDSVLHVLLHYRIYIVLVPQILRLILRVPVRATRMVMRV